MFIIRIFKAIIAVILIFLGLSILGVVYLFKNPEKIHQGFEYLVEKSLSGKDYQENEEFFLQGIETVSIDAPQVDINVRYGEGDSLKVFLKGQVSVFDGGPFIASRNITNSLNLNIQTNISSGFRLNINGEEINSNKNLLVAEIVVPTSYKNKVAVITHSGNIRVAIPAGVLTQVSADSRSGEILNSYQPQVTEPTDIQSVGSLELRSNLGNISVQNQSP